MAMNVNLSGGDMLYATNASAGAADNHLLYTSVDVSKCNYHVIENNDDATAIQLYISLDGTNFNTVPSAVLLHDDTTTGGGLKVVSIPATKIGILEGKFKKLMITQDGAGTIAIGAIKILHCVN